MKEPIELYQVYENVRCLNCGHKGAVKYFGCYLSKDDPYVKKYGERISLAVGPGGTIPLKCTNCGNVGLVDFSLEGYKRAFEKI